MRDLLNIAGIVAGVVALHLSTNVLRLDFNHLTYQVALPLMAAGFLFLPFHEPASVIGTAVHQCGYQYFYIVLWSTWPVIAAEGDMPVGLPAAWSMLAIQFGQFVGSMASAASTPLFNMSRTLSRGNIRPGLTLRARPGLFIYRHPVCRPLSRVSVRRSSCCLISARGAVALCIS